MARARRRHVQQDLPFKRHGGKRPGAGRPPKGRRASERHEKRPFHHSRYPVHATIRVLDELGSLRKRDMFEAVRAATGAAMLIVGFRIVHFSVQRNHIHLIVEALDKTRLARGMQGFEISAAKHLNAAVSRRTGRRRSGQVFADRYHPRALTTPRAVRHALASVLNNWRRHQEDRASFTSNWKVDPFSSAIAFDGWKELESSPTLYRMPSGYVGFWTWRPQTWLLRVGWTKHPLISTREIPGPSR